MSIALASAPAAPAVDADRAVVLVNPGASRVRAADASATERALARRFSVASVVTARRGDAEALAREAAASGAGVVFVLGGDGTHAEAAAGLMGSATALACLPGGCTNVFARAIGTPRRLDAAIARLIDVPLASRAVDVGLVSGRPFLCTCGVGFSASMTAAADAAAHRKARFGQVHFAAAAARSVVRYVRDPPALRVHAGGRVAGGVTAVVQNARALTYVGAREVRVAPGAGLTTGTLGVAVLRRARAGELPGLVGRLLARGGDAASHPQVSVCSDVRAVVEAADGRPVGVEADGEYLGEHLRVEFAVAPGALRVLA